MDGSILNISPLVVWVVALSQLLTFALTVWNLISSGSRKNARTLETHGDMLTGLEARVSSVEQTIRSIPDSDDFHKLELQLSKVQGTMQVLTERLRPLEAITDRMQELLLENRKRGDG